MSLCKICLKEEANQLNSHIVPFFLIKSLVAFNREDNSRGKELSYEISTNKPSTVYIGNSILPEQLDGLFSSEDKWETSSYGILSSVFDYFLIDAPYSKYKVLIHRFRFDGTVRMFKDFLLKNNLNCIESVTVNGYTLKTGN